MISHYYCASPRRAECPAVGKKPAIAIGDDWSLWLGNLTDAQMELKAGELFGFNKGVFEEKIVSAALNARAR